MQRPNGEDWLSRRVMWKTLSKDIGAKQCFGEEISSPLLPLPLLWTKSGSSTWDFTPAIVALQLSLFGELRVGGRPMRVAQCACLLLGLRLNAPEMRLLFSSVDVLSRKCRLALLKGKSSLHVARAFQEILAKGDTPSYVVSDRSSPNPRVDEIQRNENMFSEEPNSSGSPFKRFCLGIPSIITLPIPRTRQRLRKLRDC